VLADACEPLLARIAVVLPRVHTTAW
jgi:hypothetical protein